MVDQNALKSIEDLHRLKTEGVITEEEFERSKEKLLFGGKSAAPTRGPVGSEPPRPARAPGELPAQSDHFGWITQPLRRYADFTGRSCRKEFWMFQIIYASLGAVGGLALFSEDRYGDPAPGATSVFAIVLLALLGLIVPLLAVQVRRFHDQDRSGWFVALNLIPYVGGIIVYAMMLVDGTEGENRFGPDPKER